MKSILFSLLLITSTALTAQASLSTTELQFLYGRSLLTGILFPAGYNVVPGSMNLSKTLRGIITGGPSNSRDASEQYKITFLVTNKAGKVFSGETFLNITDVRGANIAINNTTRMATDAMSGRRIDIRLANDPRSRFDYENVSIDDLNLSPLKR